MPERAIDRRTFLRRSSGLMAVTAFDRIPLHARKDPSRFEHPDPRPDVTAEHVLTAEALGTLGKEKVLASYDAARTNPEIFDGLACACGCTGKHGTHRSLLSCFESLQPTGCWGCQEEAQLVAQLVKDGKSLAEIRTAIDKKWG
jgi:hypothetical protein